MKKLLSISLLLLYLFSTTQLAEVLKLQVLIEHYGEHKQADPSISVIGFLMLHYSGHHLDNHPHDEDYKRDQQLPFITQTNVLNVCFVPAQPILFEVTYKLPTCQSTNKLALNDSFIESSYLSAIWQPPKHC